MSCHESSPASIRHKPCPAHLRRKRQSFEVPDCGVCPFRNQDARIIVISRDYFALCHLLAPRDRLRYCMIESLSMEAIMGAVTISPKFQVVIPRELRKSMDIQPGAKVQILQYENRIELIPLKSPKSLRGFLKGIDTNVNREAGTAQESL